jgi:hypothetical protein
MQRVEDFLGSPAKFITHFLVPSIDGSQVCDYGIVIFLSGAAALVFFLCSLLCCCLPRPDPIFSNHSGFNDQKSTQQAGTREQPQVIVQPAQYISSQNYDEDYEYEAPPPKSKTLIQKDEPKPPKGKTSKRKDDDTNPPNEEITAEDFATPAIQEGTSSVELKEKTFPDGTRRVDEITRYEDGSKSVKTQTFKPGE